MVVVVRHEQVIDWELRSIAPEDMHEMVEVEYRDHRGAINHNMRKLGSSDEVELTCREVW